MNVEKKVIGQLEKCYSLAVLPYQGKDYLMVAAEKVNQCRLYDWDGTLKDVIWDEPGGAMSLVPVPGKEGQFLATHRFYSPNDSASASIVSVTEEAGIWKVRTLAEMPFVHRFGILKGEDGYYILACTLKSGHQYKDDWSSPGKVYAAKLPEDVTAYDTGHTLPFEILKENMLRNHGYFQVENTQVYALVTCEDGVFAFYPPCRGETAWKTEQLTKEPASDAAVATFADGEEWMMVLSPFHGDTVYFYRHTDEGFVKAYIYPEKLEFLHAICVGEYGGQRAFFAGNRKGDRKLLAFVLDDEGKWQAKCVDQGAGAANVLYYADRKLLAAANRETDEIALYTME